MARLLTREGKRKFQQVTSVAEWSQNGLKLVPTSLGSMLRGYSGASSAEAGEAKKKEEYFQFREQKIPYVHELVIPDPSGVGPMPCFRVLDETGKRIKGTDQYDMDEKLAKDIYKAMVQLQTLDTLFYEAQRQGRSGAK